MTNTELAAILKRIGQMLEIKGENPFKVRSYYRAAQVIEELADDINGLHKAGRLQTLPGIGEGIAKKIAELLETGKLKYYETLQAEIPRGMLEMLRVPGMGPKTVKLVREKLKVSDMDGLEKAARARKLRTLPRLGPKVEDKILRGIEFLCRSSGRVLLGTALPLAERLISTLGKLHSVERIEYAGSLRRMKETIRDIDILVVSSSPRAIMDAFVALPQVRQVLAKGETKSSVLCGDPAIQVDVRVVGRESFGAALQYFTGSKEHNIRLRELASKKGFKLNEYGVFKVKVSATEERSRRNSPLRETTPSAGWKPALHDNEERVGGEKEQDVYRLLGLPFIPPELREDRGEIDAAARNDLPRLVTREDLRGDLHVHSNWTDGHESIEDLARTALALGYKYLAVTDHTKSMAMTGGLAEKDIQNQGKEIDRVNRKIKDLRVLRGIEVDILADGKLDIQDGTLAKLDVVVASVHTRFRDSKETMTMRMVRALENEHVDILAHPTGRLIGEREAYEADVERLFDAAKRNGKALELNSFPERLDLSDVMCRKAKEMGIPVSIASDAHSSSQLGLVEYGIVTARRGWLEAKDVLNCRHAAELLAHLK